MRRRILGGGRGYRRDGRYRWNRGAWLRSKANGYLASRLVGHFAHILLLRRIGGQGHGQGELFVHAVNLVEYVVSVGDRCLSFVPEDHVMLSLKNSKKSIFGKVIVGNTSIFSRRLHRTDKIP